MQEALLNTIIYKKKQQQPKVIDYQLFQHCCGEVLAAFNNSNHRLLFLGFPPSFEQGIAELKRRFAQSRLTAVHSYPNPTDSCALISLELYGTDFQHKVWQALLDIPKGETCSYQSIANKIQKPTASRAVGNAVGANPIALLIPCHRVLPASKKIGNYHWGSQIKEQLLRSEQ